MEGVRKWFMSGNSGTFPWTHPHTHCPVPVVVFSPTRLPIARIARSHAFEVAAVVVEETG